MDGKFSILQEYGQSHKIWSFVSAKGGRLLPQDDVEDGPDEMNSKCPIKMHLAKRKKTGLSISAHIPVG